MKYWTWYLATE